MDNKERLDLLNRSYQQLVSHSNTIKNCSHQTDDLLCRLQEIKQKLIKGEVVVADDFKEIHEKHIQNTQYIEKLEAYENESINLKHTIDTICAKPLSDPIWYQDLKKRSLNKAILYELYRQGRFKAAQLFAQETKLKEVKKDKEKFITLHGILRALDQFNIEPALQWMSQHENKEAKSDADAYDDDSKDNDDKDINFASCYKLSKYSDILRFLLHRDKFLHISAIGTKQEMHCYMRSELEALRNTRYSNAYSQEIINNLHFEASSIAYYVEDWKLLYYLKMFPHKKLNEIPVQLPSESLRKYCNVINDNDNDNDNDIHRKRKDSNINNNISPRKKRKISEKASINTTNDKYNASYLCRGCHRDYLNETEKWSIYESFEFPELIDSVWSLSRKALINAFMNIELDLPHISGLQSCIELSWMILPKYRSLHDDISGDFDDILTLYKDLNKERHIRRGVSAFANPLMAHHSNRNQSDEDNTAANGVAVPVGVLHANTFKWEDYDTLNDDDEEEEEEDHEDDDDDNDDASNDAKQKGRFRIHSDESKIDMNVDNDNDNDGYEYGDYNDDNAYDDGEEEDMNGYIGYNNRKEFKLEMKKNKIIRRSKNKEYKDRMDKYGTAEFLYNEIHPFIDAPNKKKRSKNKLIPRPTTIILSNRSRTHRYDSRVQRPHSLSSSQRHRSHRYHSQSASPTSSAAQSSLSHLRIQPTVHRIRTNTTPPPPSDSDVADDAFLLHRNLNISQQINIPHLHRASRSSASQLQSNNNDNDDVYAHIISHSRRSHQNRRLYQNLVHRSIQQQFSPPPSNHAPLLLGTESLLAPRVVNENENDNEANALDFQGDLSSMLNPSIFASRSSSPLSSQLTGMTLEHLSMTNNPPSSTNNDDMQCSDDMAAQALLLLKNSKSQEIRKVMASKKARARENYNHNRNNRNNKNKNKNDVMEDEEDEKSKCSKMEIDNENVTEMSSYSVPLIDWENESDSSQDEERYLSQKDKDILKNKEQNLKISMRMSEDFVIPNGYLSHSIFVCPIQTDYVCDPQAKLGCGHLISYNAFVRLQNMQRQRQHQESRNRNLKIHCPNCDQQSDVDKDVRYVYLGRFPNLRVDSRFADILDKKNELDPNATKWIPGATQINGQE